VKSQLYTTKLIKKKKKKKTRKKGGLRGWSILGRKKNLVCGGAAFGG
jgi:hypothetical protein